MVAICKARTISSEGLEEEEKIHSVRFELNAGTDPENPRMGCSCELLGKRLGESER